MNPFLFVLLLILSATAHAQFHAAGVGPEDMHLGKGWGWDDDVLTWDSDRYNGRRTALARWPVFVDRDGFCRLTVCFDVDISTPKKQDGRFTRTGFTVQLWDNRGRRGRKHDELGSMSVYKSGGYRGQTDFDGCLEWEGEMGKGDWEIRSYVHKNRATRPYSQPEGLVDIRKIELIRLR